MIPTVLPLRINPQTIVFIPNDYNHKPRDLYSFNSASHAHLHNNKYFPNDKTDHSLKRFTDSDEIHSFFKTKFLFSWLEDQFNHMLQRKTRLVPSGILDILPNHAKKNQNAQNHASKYARLTLTILMVIKRRKSNHSGGHLYCAATLLSVAGIVNLI